MASFTSQGNQKHCQTCFTERELWQKRDQMTATELATKSVAEVGTGKVLSCLDDLTARSELLS